MEKTLFEQTAWSNGTKIVGIDEVGRGCLMGPLVAVACMLKPCSSHHPNCDVLNYALLKDSKILSQKELIKAYLWLQEHSIFGIGIVTSRLVDELNVYKATQKAMSKALNQIVAIQNYEISRVLIDAMPLSHHDIPTEHFPFGEQRSVSIAAASIIAKVTRDNIMKRLDMIFPGYDLKNHNGYGTPAHYQALKTESHTILHRTSYLKNELKPIEDSSTQITIF